MIAILFVRVCCADRLGAGALANARACSDRTHWRRIFPLGLVLHLVGGVLKEAIEAW